MSGLSFVLATAKEQYRGVWLYEMQTGGYRIEIGGREYYAHTKEEAQGIIDMVIDSVVVTN